MWAQMTSSTKVHSTITLICRMVELRDLHTAGHQQRVAALSAAIGSGLGLDQDGVERVRLAALIHDVGKMAVPIEVLSKPGNLTALEWQFLRNHVQTGYDVICDVEGLGVIAVAILQHHERLDGSGYPHGLVSQEIGMDARILAVADVVEAMASHRPYRSALGVDAALDEVTSRAGSLFDRDAVSVCVQLFRTEEFHFPDPGSLMWPESPLSQVNRGWAPLSLA